MVIDGKFTITEEEIEFLRLLTCPIDVRVRNKICAQPLVLHDVMLTGMDDDGATLEVTIEQAELLKEYLEATA